MMIKKISGRHAYISLAGLFLCHSAYAWQQEYIVSDAESNTTERYTWDADHQPRYEDILEERIRTSQTVSGLALTMPENYPAESTSTLSLGVSIPVTRNITTGPVAAWHYDGSSSSLYNEFGDNVNTATLTDPLWHASVSTLGWRVDSQWGELRPWAQISYNQQFGDNQWKSQSGLNRLSASMQNGNWTDVTVGADVLLHPHMAAYASLSQADNAMTGEDYLYTLGVSARF
ncbi:autotransporter domain-containing protein [Enterobacteriaceae bacterium 155047]|uniref:autotransporter domain-containing protein n=1 Tax=Huaxiibacter chinensis TaxID=2899785 RepID=UPI0007DAA38D|nr:autotransporter domain-containing protein [Huaxiibacter chinensis]ANG91063.1 autotransporter outer membrane beta-barrel domain-containing protein [Lelliottia amnigena]MCG5045309.1 autotransporter domain-containing protein [Huaxiibacter chinensis]